MPETAVLRGRYRKPGYYRHGGEEIVGLKRRPDGRFYAAAKPTKTFGKDPSLAVFRFRSWQMKNGVGQPEPLDDIARGTYPNHLNYIRDLILLNPNAAAQELEIPELAYFHQLRPPPEPTLSLQELGSKYENERRNKRGNPLSDKHRHQASTVWEEFIDHIGVKYANSITEERIQKYAADILSRYDKGKSQAYVKSRFGSIKTIIAFAARKGIDSTELERVLRLCKMHFEMPAPPPPNPQPISPEQFQALLDIADVRQKAILLSALNFCMKSGEVADLIKSDIDFEKGTLVTTRNKTGATRIAVLWKRTADAIRAYLKKHPHHAEHLFNSRIGTPLTAKAAGRIVIQLRRKAKLPESVCFDTIRDGGYTAAIEGGASETHAKLLAGHSVRMSDHYVRRNPKMVADACEAIERHYFS